MDNCSDGEMVVGGASGLSEVLGYFFPGAGAFADILDHYQKRRVEERVSRLESFVKLLESRIKLSDLPNKPTDEQIDLFDDILEAVVKEGEKEKCSYYVALVDIYLREQLPASVIRVLGAALKGLTAFELQAFERYSDGGQMRFGEDDLVGSSLFLRLTSFGMFTTGAPQRLPKEYTPLGKKLLFICTAAKQGGQGTPAPDGAEDCSRG